jgi:outer membrane protein TolC
MRSVSGTVVAEDRKVSLDDVLRIGLEKSPELGRIDSLLAERLGEAEETRVKQNPSLGTELRVPASSGGDDSEYEATVYQPLRASDFGFRSKVSALIRESASIEEKLALVEFTQNLTLTYANTWAVQERRGVLVNAQERARGILEKVRGVASKGFLPEGDVAVFEGEVSLLSAEMVGAEAERKRVVAELTRVSGAELAGAMLLPPPVPRLPARDEVLRQAQENALPAQRRSEILARVASRQLELARLDSFPRLAPGIGYERTAEGAQQLIIGFSMDLPFFDRNQAARVRALGAERAATRLRNHATSGRLAEEARMLHEAAAALADQRRRFEEEVVPSRERALKGYRKQFDVGQGTAFQVWQAQREFTEARLRVLEIWSQERTALAELGILLGTDL